jgi:hypothetical protein
MFSAILYIHIITALVLAAAMSVEGFALRQLRRASEKRDTLYWLDPLPGMRPVASICLLILLLSGGFLAGVASLWKLAWPSIAVVIVLAFGALAGISSRRMRQMRQACQQAELMDAAIPRKARSPFLKISLGVRTGLVLAAVLLMTVQPGLVGSLVTVVVFVVVFWGVAALKSSAERQRSPAQTPEF